MAKRGTLDCTKNVMLALTLGVGRGVTFGCLTTLWHKAGSDFIAGRLTQSQIMTIFKSTGWDGVVDPEKLIEAMTRPEHRWLDPLPDGSYYIHDWHDHCEDSVHAKLYRDIRRFGNGTTPKPKKISKSESAELAKTWEAENHRQPVAAAGSQWQPALPSHALPSHALIPPTPLGGEGKGEEDGEEPQSPPDNPIHDFPEPVQAQAREVLVAYWVRREGCLPNYHRRDVRSQLREWASIIAVRTGAAAMLLAYFAQPPPGHPKVMRVWEILEHLGLRGGQQRGEQRRSVPGGDDYGDAARYDGSRCAVLGAGGQVRKGGQVGAMEPGQPATQSGQHAQRAGG